VFDTADKRLQPEYATGFLLNSREIDGMNLTAGHFTAFQNQDSSSSKGNFSGYGANTDAGGISFAGADLFTQSPVGGALYASELTDTWYQYYGNLHLKQPGIFLDGNITAPGRPVRLAGAIDNTAYSLSGKYTVGAHGFTLAYQKSRATHRSISSVAIRSTSPTRSSTPTSTARVNARGRHVTTST
jgi:hypothetical protein